MVKDTLIMKKGQKDATWGRFDLLVMIWLDDGGRGPRIKELSGPWAIPSTYNQQEHEDLGPVTQDTELCQQPE